MFRTLLVACSVASIVLASSFKAPTPFRPIKRPRSVSTQLEKRISAEFSLAHQWDNDVLFSGYWLDDGILDAVETVHLSATCIECWTKGTITASLTDEDIIDPTVRLDFRGVEAYLDLEFRASSEATYAVNLLSTDDPLEMGLPNLDVGVMFHVDVVFAVDAMVDLDGGFHVVLGDDAYLETSVFGGDITDFFL